MEKRYAETRCIAIVGLPASGKTSIGSALAHRLGVPFVDLDEQIVKAEGRTIAQIFKVDGEAVFRQLESAFLEHATRDGTLVVSTGGGCVLAPGNRSLLRERCFVVWLDLSPELAAVRAEAGSRMDAGRSAMAPAVRPLLPEGDLLDRMKVLDAIRRPLYRGCADIVVQVGDKTPASIVEELYAALD